MTLLFCNTSKTIEQLQLRIKGKKKVSKDATLSYCKVITLNFIIKTFYNLSLTGRNENSFL